MSGTCTDSKVTQEGRIIEEDNLPDEAAAAEWVLLPRPLFAAPDLPLVHVADGRVRGIPALPAVRRAAVVRDRGVAVLGDDRGEHVFVQHTGWELGDVCRREYQIVSVLEGSREGRPTDHPTGGPSGSLLGD